MSINNLRGQFLRGQGQTIEKPNQKNITTFHDSNMPSAYTLFKPNGHILPKKGAI